MKIYKVLKKQFYINADTNSVDKWTEQTIIFDNLEKAKKYVENKNANTPYLIHLSGGTYIKYHYELENESGDTIDNKYQALFSAT